MKLDFEMIPDSTCSVNLRGLLSHPEWNWIRRVALREYDNRCAICGRSNGRLECHEVWSFDDARHIQRLERVIPLCAMCHHVKHIGMAGRLARAGRLEYWRVVNHYCEVNDCSADDFYRARAAAYRLVEWRNRYVWAVDVSGFMAWGGRKTRRLAQEG